MNRVKFTVPGKAVSWKRVASRGGVRYNPKDMVYYQNLVKMAYSAVSEQRSSYRGEVYLSVELYVSIPTSLSRRKREELKNKCPVTKPDLSNVIKNVEDALNGVAYYDDSQIVAITSGKYYSDVPRVEVQLYYVEG